MSTDAQGRILYTASADATIRSWNINQGQLLKVNIISLMFEKCRLVKIEFIEYLNVYNNLLQLRYQLLEF